MKVFLFKILTFFLLVSSLGFATPPKTGVSIESLMHHLGIRSFRAELVGEKEPLFVEITRVENGKVEQTENIALIRMNGVVEATAIDVLFEKTGRSEYSFTVFPVGATAWTNKNFKLNWKGSNNSYLIKELEIGGPPVLFTGDLIEANLEERVRELQSMGLDITNDVISVKSGLMISIAAQR